MNKLGKYTILLLLLCSNAMSMQKKKTEEDPFALFKLPTHKATVHYLKKGGKEFVYLKGKDLKDYTVLTNDNGVSLDVRGYKIKGRANLSKKSTYVDNVKTSVTDSGSMVNLALKGKPGFKVYRRPSGLVLAMGPGYQEIAENDLEGLDSEISSSSSLDTELDGMLKEEGLSAPATATATANANDVDTMLDSLESETLTKEAKAQLNQPIAKTGTDTLDKDLDRILSESESDLALSEQKEVESGLERPTTLENIKLEKVNDKIQLVLQTDKVAKYQQKESKPGYNQIIIEIPNAKIVKKIKTVDTKLSEGLITSITPQMLKGPYKAVRVIVQLSKDVQPEVLQRNNLIYLGFPLEAMEGAVATTEGKAKPGETDDMEAARQFSRVNFEDYLAKPTDFYGRRMSIQVSNANVLDVLRMIQ
ncbi:MAG: AMIN domain-containing protein, partial [bacterium]